MSHPLDQDEIAKAMQRAAWIAAHGTRDERAGRFTPRSVGQAAAFDKITPRKKS
jgi:hypothetical protein